MTALALVPAGAHLFELPNKIGLSEDEYFTVQNSYRGWNRFGAVLVGAIAANAVLAVLLRKRGRPGLLATGATLLMLLTLVTFFTLVYPANLATENWTVVTEDWQALRARWEYGHATTAIITFAALVLSALSGLLATEKFWP